MINNFQSLCYKIFPWIFLAYTAAIFLLAVFPVDHSLGSQNDIINHVLAFFVFMILGSLAYKKMVSLLLVIIGIIYGAVIEFIQYFIPYRQASWLDIFADMTGLILGWLVITLFYRSFRAIFDNPL